MNGFWSKMLRNGVALLLLGTSAIHAQNVKNVDATQEGKEIAITYNLKERSDISVFISYDNGKNKTEIPVEFLSGAVGKKVEPGEGKKALWNVLDQYPNENFQGENLSFIVKGWVCMRTFVVLNGGYSLDSGPIAGFCAGQFGQIGWYVKGMTTFAKPQNSKYSCNEEGYIDTVFPMYSGKASKFKIYGVGGLLVRLGAPIYLNAGVGYGYRCVDWQTYDGQWVHNIPQSYDGITVDVGLMANIKHICVSAATTILKGHVDVNVGIGYMF